MVGKLGLGPGRHRADPTLYLYVAPSGGRSWIQRIVLPDGRQVDRGLGGWPVVTLQDARLAALENRRKVRAGMDPCTERERTVPTFAELALDALEQHRASWSTASVRSWESGMRRHVLPRLGAVRVDRLTRQHVIDALCAIGSTAETRKAKRRIAQVLELALARGLVESNPAANGGLDAAVPALRVRGAAEHHAAAAHADVAGVLTAVDAGQTSPTVAACLRFLVLTAARSAEARGATWAEVDLDARCWTVAAARTKSGREHRVPLSGAAVTLLEARRGEHPVYVFASDRTGRPLSPESLRTVVQRAAGATVHGFRSSFRDWAGDTGQPRELAEAALAHVSGDATEQAYARSDLFARRRVVMDAWAAYLLAR